MTRDPLDRACELLSRLGYEETAADLREQVRELQGEIVKAQVEAIERAARQAAADPRRAR